MNKSDLNIYAIVLNWNNFSDTDKCLTSLVSISDERIKIVIVDNKSTDESVKLFKEKYTDLPLIISQVNNGYAGGMNLGIKYALDHSADYIIISNNDVVYTKDFLDPLLELFVNDNSIGIVSPKVLYTHNKDIIYCAGADFKLLRGSGVAAFQGKVSAQFGNDVREITMAEGSCFLAKKEVFEKSGLFGVEFFMYFEDLEFSDRVRKNFKIFYTPKSIIYHKGGGGTSWKNHSPLYYYYYTRNRYIYFKKYSFFVKIYILLYSIFVSLIKTISIGMNFLLKENDDKNKDRIKSLVSGNVDGIKEFFN